MTHIFIFMWFSVSQADVLQDSSERVLGVVLQLSSCSVNKYSHTLSWLSECGPPEGRAEQLATVEHGHIIPRWPCLVLNELNS